MVIIPIEIFRKNSMSYDRFYPKTISTFVEEAADKNFMTDAERVKLNGIAEGATKVTVSDTLTSTSKTNALSAAQGKVLQDSKAPLASPSLTGVPTAPTASASTNSNQIATTAFIRSVVGESTKYTLTLTGVTEKVPFTYRKVGGMVVAYGTFNPINTSQFANAGHVTIGTMPAGYRPQLRTFGVYYAGPRLWELTIDNSGGVTVGNVYDLMNARYFSSLDTDVLFAFEIVFASGL